MVARKCATRFTNGVEIVTCRGFREKSGKVDASAVALQDFVQICRLLLGCSFNLSCNVDNSSSLTSSASIATCSSAEQSATRCWGWGCGWGCLGCCGGWAWSWSLRSAASKAAAAAAPAALLARLFAGRYLSLSNLHGGICQRIIRPVHPDSLLFPVL